MSNEPMDMNSTNPVDRDLLISRVVDDAATVADWQQVRAMAEHDPSVWRELFETQHAQSEFAQAVHQAIQIADGVEAPSDDSASSVVLYRFRKASVWAGWAVAAGVALAWLAPAYVIGPAVQPPQPGDTTAVAGSGREYDVTTQSGPIVLPRNESTPGGLSGALASDDRGIASPDTLRQVSSGPHTQAMGEMPDRVLLEVRPLPDGRMELIYVRRIIEKAIIGENDLYQVVPDDTGTQRAVPLRQRRPSSGPI